MPITTLYSNPCSIIKLELAKVAVLLREKDHKKQRKVPDENYFSF